MKNEKKMYNQREKLIELICCVNCEGNENFGNCPERRNGHCRSIHKLEMCQVGAIADHLLANGVIVPPCKVGDKVYFVCFDEDCEKFIDKGRAYAISQNENTLWFSVRYLSGLRYDHTSSDFGKTVFLSREDAEKALEEAE